MNRTSIPAVLALGLAAAGGLSTAPFSLLRAQPAAAQQTAQTVILAVENMTCDLCPVTVKKAMERVAGVRSVRVDFKRKTATVVFDPSITSVGAIAAASRDAGYPAAPAG